MSFPATTAARIEFWQRDPKTKQDQLTTITVRSERILIDAYLVRLRDEQLARLDDVVHSRIVPLPPSTGDSA